MFAHFKYFLKFILIYRKDSSTETNEQIKNKIRERLQIVNHELAETSCTNAPDEGIDYFELIYECVEKRNIFLNFIDFNCHNLTGDDVDLAILQARLKGNRNK